VITAIPDLVVLEKPPGLFLSHLNFQEIIGSLVGVRDEVLIAQKRTETDEKGDKEQREGDSIKADSPRFERRDLTVSGKVSKAEKGGKQYGIG